MRKLPIGLVQLSIFIIALYELFRLKNQRCHSFLPFKKQNNLMLVFMPPSEGNTNNQDC
jgi:hypothetical protein